MKPISKRKLIKQLVDEGLFCHLSHLSLPPNVVDKLLDISIKRGRINGALFIIDYSNFNHIYKICAIDEDDEQDLNIFFKLIDVYFIINETYNLINKESTELIINAYNLFDDKKKTFKVLLSIIEMMDQLKNQLKFDDDKLKNYLANIDQYLRSSRKYYNDEVIYLSRIMSSLFILRKNNSFNNLIGYDEKTAGIYNVDEDKIKELEDKISELENKLESIEENANKNIETYNKIDEKAGNLLSDISKYQIEDRKKTFKISNKNKTDEKERLLRLVRKHNINFQFHIDNENWFCKEVIDKLGIEYIADSFHSEQHSISIAYDNDQIDTLSQILKINNSFIVFDSIILNQEIIELFGIDMIANTFYTSTMQDLISTLYEKKEINFLKKLLEINPHFKFYEITDWFNKNVIDIFGIEFIAKNFSEYTQGFIYWNFSSVSYAILKEINDINPKFIVDQLLPELPLVVVRYIQNAKYLANLNIDKIKVIQYFNRFNHMYKLNNILMLDQNFTINDYIAENEEENITQKKQEIIKNIIKNLEPNAIIKMFENDSINYKKLYNCVVLTNDVKSFQNTFESLFYEMPEEYKDQILNLDFIDQDDITKLDSSKQKAVLKKLNTILRNYKIQRNIKKLIKK